MLQVVAMRSLFTICVYSIFWRLADGGTNATKEKQTHFGEKYGNPVLEVSAEEVKLLDGSDIMNLTCTVTENYQRVIKTAYMFLWFRKPPTSDKWHAFLLIKTSGKLLWGNKVTWKKLDTMKKHGGSYGNFNSEQGRMYLTLFIPIYPCEDNGIFQCSLMSDTYQNKIPRIYRKFYRFNDTAICTVSTTSLIGDPVVRILGVVAGGLLIGISLAVICGKLIKFRRERSRKKKLKPKKMKRSEREQSRKKSSKRHRKSRSPRKRRRSRRRDSNSVSKRGPPSPPPPAVGTTPPPHVMETLPSTHTGMGRNNPQHQSMLHFHPSGLGLPPPSRMRVSDPQPQQSMLHFHPPGLGLPPPSRMRVTDPQPNQSMLHFHPPGLGLPPPSRMRVTDPLPHSPQGNPIPPPRSPLQQSSPHDTIIPPRGPLSVRPSRHAAPQTSPSMDVPSTQPQNARPRPPTLGPPPPPSVVIPPPPSPNAGPRPPALGPPPPPSVVIPPPQPQNAGPRPPTLGPPPPPSVVIPPPQPQKAGPRPPTLGPPPPPSVVMPPPPSPNAGPRPPTLGPPPPPPPSVGVPPPPPPSMGVPPPPRPPSAPKPALKLGGAGGNRGDLLASINARRVSSSALN